MKFTSHATRVFPDEKWNTKTYQHISRSCEQLRGHLPYCNIHNKLK